MLVKTTKITFRKHMGNQGHFWIKVVRALGSASLDAEPLKGRVIKVTAVHRDIRYAGNNSCSVRWGQFGLVGDTEWELAFSCCVQMAHALRAW